MSAAIEAKQANDSGAPRIGRCGILAPMSEYSIWRSAVTIGIAIAAMGVANGIVAGVATPDISAVAIAVANGLILGVVALPVLVALDWATRRRRQFASRSRP
jgi:hypothetical protein